MGLPRIIFYVGCRMIMVLLAGMGFAFDYTGASILSWSPNNWGILGFIAFGAFVILTLVREVDLAFQQRPKIKAEPKLLNNVAVLELINDGTLTKVTIRGKLKQGNLQTNMYDIYVGDINKDDKNTVRIAEIKNSSFFDSWIDFSKMTDVDKVLVDVMWEDFYKQKNLRQMYPAMEHTTEEIIVEITLTTDKPMTRPHGTRDYSLKCSPIDGLTFTTRE